MARLDLASLASALTHAGYRPVIEPGDLLVRVYGEGDRYVGVSPCADYRLGYRVVSYPDAELLGEWVPFAAVRELIDAWVGISSA